MNRFSKEEEEHFEWVQIQFAIYIFYHIFRVSHFCMDFLNVTALSREKS